MKSFSMWKSMVLVIGFLGIFALSQIIFQTQPPQVQAQDIDDVLDTFSEDFGFADKDDIKQENVQNANEQNREDVQIKINEEQQNAQNQMTQTTPATHADVTVNFTATGNDAHVTTSLGSVAGFMGVIATTMPVNFTYMMVPVGVNILTINCLGSTPGNCNINLGGIVNAGCTPLTLSIPNSTSGSSTCTVTAPVPLP